jgi:hypothetical protein
MPQPLNSSTCKSCAAPLTGKYCAACGEKVIEPEDRSAAALLKQFAGTFFFLDGKLFSTLAALILKPGVLTKAYIDGRRQKYLSPFQLFLIANLLYFAFPLVDTFNSSFENQRYRMPYSGWVVQPLVENYLSEVPLSAREEMAQGVASRFNVQTTKFAKTLIILNVPLFAVAVWLLFRAKRIYFADALAFSFHFYVMFIVLLQLGGLVIMLLSERIGNAYFTDARISVFLLVISALYLRAAARRAFDVSGRSAILYSVALFLLMSLVLLLYRFALFLITWFMLI